MRYSTGLPAASPTLKIRQTHRAWSLGVRLALLLVLSVVPVWAQGTNGSSMACGEEMLVRLTPFQGDPSSAGSEPAPMATGQAPSDYLAKEAMEYFSMDLPGAGEVVRASSMSSQAAGTVDEVEALTSDSTVENVEVWLAGDDPLFTLSATVVRAEATVWGPCGDALNGYGAVTIEDARLGGSLGSGLEIPVNPATNTVLLNQSGVRVVLNERILTGSGFGSLRLVTNAIHIELDGAMVAGLGVLDGDIVLGHAEAELSCGDEL